jgi:Metallo-beta-lactamase superfamily
MPVNSYILYGPDGVVVVDSMLTVSDATRVREAVRASGRTMAGVVVTHPHPDHYAGLGHLVGDDAVPIIATAAVDAIIRRDDEVKNAVVGPRAIPGVARVRGTSRSKTTGRRSPASLGRSIPRESAGPSIGPPERPPRSTDVLPRSERPRTAAAGPTMRGASRGSTSAVASWPTGLSAHPPAIHLPCCRSSPARRTGRQPATDRSARDAAALVPTFGARLWPPPTGELDWNL